MVDLTGIILKAKLNITARYELCEKGNSGNLNNCDKCRFNYECGQVDNIIKFTNNCLFDLCRRFD